MGTRSLIHFQQDGDTLCTVYQQYDGYPEGVGKQLFNFLKEIRVVNGIPLGEERKVANGAGCLTAQFIARYKDGAGGFYIYPPNASDCWEEYTYFVNVTDDLEVEIGVGEFSGTVTEFGQWIDSFNEDEVA